jgi:periplasmic protein CpxP/Spy
MKYFLCILCVVLTLTAFAQQPKQQLTPEQRADSATARLEKKLGLNADQKSKVHDLVLTREQKLDDLRKQYAGQDPSVWKAQRKQVREEFRDGMRATLTAEQYAKWQQMKKVHRGRKK